MKRHITIASQQGEKETFFYRRGVVPGCRIPEREKRLFKRCAHILTTEKVEQIRDASS